MNTPKRLLSGCDDTSERRRLRLASNDDLSTPIEQVAKRHRVSSDTVKRIFSDLLNESTVIEYLRARINQEETTTISPIRHDESTYFDSSNTFSQNILSTTMVDEYDPIWLEFVQSLTTAENNNLTNIQQNTTQSTVTFDSLFSEDDDDEEFIGPDDENHIENTDEKKLRVSRRELALLLKDNNATPDDQISSHPDEELLPSDQYESLWKEFLAELQKENDEQQTSIITTTTTTITAEDDDNDDDPEFRLPDTDYDIDDDLGDELHVSKRELALLLEDNASILNNEEFVNPESVSSNTTCSTITKTFEFHLTSEQRNILQYQLTAYVQLLTQYILLKRETDGLSTDDQSALQLFKDLIYFRDKQSHSILDIPLLIEAQRLIESPPPSNRRKALGNHLPFHLMNTFCKNSAFVHDSLLPTCLLSSNNFIFNEQSSRNFVSGEDCLIALGLEQNNAKMLIIGHSEKNINERLNSLRYARVRRGKQNPVKAFFTYGCVPDISLNPWYHPPNGYDIEEIYPNGLIEKVNVVFPSWFRFSYKRSRQLTKRANNSLVPTSNSTIDPNDSLSSSTVYVVVEDSTSNSRTITSPNKVLQQIHMLHLLNSYPKLQPKQS